VLNKFGIYRYGCHVDGTFPLMATYENGHSRYAVMPATVPLFTDSAREKGSDKSFTTAKDNVGMLTTVKIIASTRITRLTGVFLITNRLS
jgi:hypothetical protein